MDSSQEIVDASESGGSLSRRQFVRRVGAVAVAGALLPVGVTTGVVSAAPAQEAILSMAAFRATLKQNYRVATGHGTLVMRLHSVTDLTPPRPSLAQAGQAFRLQFQAPAGTALHQGTYHFTHPRLKRFAMFIVPMGSIAGKPVYEAVFNLLPS